MNQKDIIKRCKELGCCNACCIRYIGLKSPTAYENAQQFICKFVDGPSEPLNIEKPKAESSTQMEGSDEATKCDLSETKCNDDVSGEPPVKKMKTDDICVSCIGVLQEENWPQSYNMIKDMLDKKCYECSTFACALSAPIATILRERVISLHLKKLFSDYDDTSVTPLKEAWKWSFGAQLAVRVRKELDSGAVSPLLVTLHVEYPDDLQELEILKTVSPTLFESRSKQRRRFAVEFTRRSVEQALEGATLEALGGRAGAAPRMRAAPVSVLCAHAPLYLGGRYVKLSRALPQTPWLVNGRRMMHSSVQEIICEPIADLYRLSMEEAEHRLKFMSAGREDVDVRCLGDGRPFAIEVTDPPRAPSAAELRALCARISADRVVVVNTLVPVSREDLTQLKQGEQTKCKTYEALCIKLSHSDQDEHTANGTGEGGAGGEIRVTARDIDNINSYTNTEQEEGVRVVLQQRTPIRVLHRRPLLTRTRRILELRAHTVPEHPQLFVVRVRTEAGTYVKEWAHGEVGRTRPSLADALRARTDILALDVASVDLPWPLVCDTDTDTDTLH